MKKSALKALTGVMFIVFSLTGGCGSKKAANRYNKYLNEARPLIKQAAAIYTETGKWMKSLSTTKTSEAQQLKYVQKQKASVEELLKKHKAIVIKDDDDLQKIKEINDKRIKKVVEVFDILENSIKTKSYKDLAKKLTKKRKEISDVVNEFFELRSKYAKKYHLTIKD